MRNAFLLPLLALLSSASCVPVDGSARSPLPDVTGAWTGDVLGVRVRMQLEQRPYNNEPDFGILSGSGWLVSASPAESLYVLLGGTNYRDETRPVSVLLGTGTDAPYGQLALTPNADGTLTGTLRRRPNRLPPFSPFDASWPAGAASVPVSFARY